MNIGQMMKQVQDMQAKMADMQNRMGDVVVQGEAGGGAVVVTMSGKAEVRKVAIDPKYITPDDKETLEDLIVAAVNNAKAKADKQISEETEKMMGGLKLPPGVKLPF